MAFDLFFAPENKTDEECVAEYGCLPCANCRCCDFVEDFEHGANICVNCGACDDGIQVLCNTYKETHGFNGAISVNTRRCAFSARAFQAVHKTQSLPYKRQTYFNERLSQWCCQEPAIPADDEYRIVNCWLLWAPEVWPHDWRTYASKPRIRAVLGYLDDNLQKVGERPHFVRVYLEKWLTIRRLLTGIPSYGQNVSCYVLQRMRQNFDALQEPFDRFVRAGLKRHSLLNYNFIIRRLLQLQGLHYAIVDFPPLKTAAKQQQLVAIWKKICVELNWPYINNDVDAFPEVKFYVK